MSTERTDKILAMLDDALQSTTGANIGIPIGDPVLCVCCQRAFSIKGRSWCETCLPEANDVVDEPDPFGLNYGPTHSPAGRDDSITTNALGPTGDGGNEDDEWEEIEDGELYDVIRTALGLHLAECRDTGAAPAAAMVVHDEDGNAIGFAVNVEAAVLTSCSEDFHAFLESLEIEVRRRMGENS